MATAAPQRRLGAHSQVSLRPITCAAGVVSAVVLSGEIDMERVPEIDAFLRRAFGPFFFRRHLLIDLGSTTLVDSSFVSYVAGLAARARRGGFDVVLARPVGQVRRTLATVGLPNLVAVYDSLDEAAELICEGRLPLIPPAFSLRPPGG